MSDTTDATDATEGVPAASDGIDGPRVVLTIYLGVIAIAGAMGALIGFIRPVELDPELFFLIQLPPTALGMAVFGMVTVGTGLGVLLGAVWVISNRMEE